MLVLTPTDKCSSCHNQCFLFFSFLQQMETIAEIDKCLKYREYVTMGCQIPVGLSAPQSLYLKLRGYHRRGSRKSVRTIGPWYLLLHGVFYIPQGKCTHEISILWLPIQDLNNENTSWHTSVDGGVFTRSYHRWRATGNRWLVWEGESVLSRDESLDRPSNPMWSALNTQT